MIRSALVTVGAWLMMLIALGGTAILGVLHATAAPASEHARPY